MFLPFNSMLPPVGRTDWTDTVAPSFHEHRSPLPAGRQLHVESFGGVGDVTAKVEDTITLGARIRFDDDLCSRVEEGVGIGSVTRCQQDPLRDFEARRLPTTSQALLVVGSSRRRPRIEEPAIERRCPAAVPFDLTLPESEQMRRVEVHRVCQRGFQEAVSMGVEEQHPTGATLHDPISVHAQDTEIGAGAACVVNEGIGGQRVDLVGDERGRVEHDGVDPAATVFG